VELTAAATLQVDVAASVGGTAVVAVHGELCALTAPSLGDALDRVVGEGALEVVIDLAGLELCTSHGLEVLDACHRALQGRGGSLLLHGERGSVARLLALVHDLDPAFLA